MFRNSTNRGKWNIPPVTKNLIIINCLLWLVEVLFPGSIGAFFMNHLALHFFEGSLFNPAQVFTYMFLHSPDSVFHLLFNMFTLWMFGRLMEQVWGGRRFLTFYLVCGVGAALIQEAVWAVTWEHDFVEALAKMNGLTYDTMQKIFDSGLRSGDLSLASSLLSYKNMMMTVGASGAVFGILLGFAFVFPNLPLYLFFIPIPIKAKYMVAGYAVIEFFLGISQTQSTVAHFAHLGGMLFGLVMLLYWRKKGTLGGNMFG